MPVKLCMDSPSTPPEPESVRNSCTWTWPSFICGSFVIQLPSASDFLSSSSAQQRGRERLEALPRLALVGGRLPH